MNHFKTSGFIKNATNVKYGFGDDLNRNMWQKSSFGGLEICWDESLVWYIWLEADIETEYSKLLFNVDTTNSVYTNEVTSYARENICTIWIYRELTLPRGGIDRAQSNFDGKLQEIDAK